MTTTTTLNLQTLNQLCIVHADFDIWSGKARLEASDINFGAGGEIPPEKLTSLGSKKICDPSDISRFHALKTQTRRLLSHYGLRFMNGYAIPQSKLQYVQSELDLIEQQFLIERQQFLDNYEDSVNKWVDENPDFADAIRRGIMPLNVVSERIGFKHTIYNINPVGEESAKQLSRQVDGLTNDLYAEIEAEAESFYDRYLNGVSHLNGSTKPSLEKLYDKVDGLSFMNASLDPLAKLLKETIDGFDAHKVKNRIEAPYLFQICSVVLICADKDKIHGYANGSVKVDNVFSGAGLSDDDEMPAVPVQSGLLAETPPAETTPPETVDAPSDVDTSVSAEVTAAKPASDPTPSGLSTDLLGDMDNFFAEFMVNSDAPAFPASSSNVETEPKAAVEALVEEQPQVAETVATEEVAVEAVQEAVTVEEAPATPQHEQSLAESLAAMGAMPMEFDPSAMDGAELPVFAFEDDEEW